MDSVKVVGLLFEEVDVCSEGTDMMMGRVGYGRDVAGGGPIRGG